MEKTLEHLGLAPRIPFCLVEYRVRALTVEANKLYLQSLLIIADHYTYIFLLYYPPVFHWEDIPSA